MIIEASFGTPDTMEPHTYKTPAPAKKFLRDKMRDRERWAARFNSEVERRLKSAREEFDGIDVKTLPVGETRSWRVTDDVSGVTFMYSIKVVAQ